MFKNELSIIRRTVQVPGPGTNQLARRPASVHSTWWIGSDTDVVTRMTLPPSILKTPRPLQLVLGGRGIDVATGGQGLNTLSEKFFIKPGV
jgi:hypothetical protein